MLLYEQWFCCCTSNCRIVRVSDIPTPPVESGTVDAVQVSGPYMSINNSLSYTTAAAACRCGHCYAICRARLFRGWMFDASDFLSNTRTRGILTPTKFTQPWNICWKNRTEKGKASCWKHYFSKKHFRNSSPSVNGSFNNRLL